MTFDKQFQFTENMINETLLNSYCEWVWYNVTQNTTSIAFEVILPDGTPDDDIPEYHLMHHFWPKYNQMCSIKFNALFLSEHDTIKQINVLQEIMFPYYILIVSLGLLGNCLSTCVFFSTKLRYSSPSIYLGALAISDNCYLILHVAYSYLNPNLFFEKIFAFSTYFCSSLSAWLVIVFTVERFIAIKWPLHRKSFCTVARAKIMIIILTTVMFLVNIPIIAFMYEQRSDSAIYRICQNVITNIIPVYVVTIFNILVLYNISKSYRKRRNLTAMSITCSENRDYQNWMSHPKIFLVSFAFMFLNMPICVASISSEFIIVYRCRNECSIINITADNDYTSVIFTLAIMRNRQVWMNSYFWTLIPFHLYYTNFAINFFLYCVSGKSFRKDLVDIFTKSVNQFQNLYVHITNR